MSVGDPAPGGLVVDGVSVRYGSTLALDRVTLEVGPGEVVALIGPSGSGKSTLLRVVAGLEPLAEGRVSIGGRDLAAVPTHRRGLGLMFQDHGLFAHLDVFDNVGYGLRVAGADAGEVRARVGRILDLVGLSDLADRSVGQLSGGEAQRVALARALAPEPGLLMLDEPLGSLDRGLREQLTEELRRLLTELGQTSLHVTHDQAEAFALADRVAVLDGGRLVAIGRPAELWSDPGTGFVARFLGHRNLWSVEIDPGGLVRIGATTLGSLDAEHPILRAGRVGPVDVVLPSTAIEVALGRSGADPASGAAVEVETVVFDRGRYRIRGRLLADGSSGCRPVGEPAGVECESPVPVRAGERVSVRFDLGAMRSLDPGPGWEPSAR